jgi:hypothetical protein
MPKPDFTGEWTLNVEASSLSPVVAPVVQSGFAKIQHREPTVEVHLSITMDGKPVDVRFERPSEWDGDTLVFSDKVPLPSGGAAGSGPSARQRVGVRSLSCEFESLRASHHSSKLFCSSRCHWRQSVSAIDIGSNPKEFLSSGRTA